MRALMPVEFGDRGDSVGALHQALELLAVAAPISDEERAQQRYGEGTREAVATLQRQYGWSDGNVGQFDEQCAARVNALIARSGFRRAGSLASGEVGWVPFRVPNSAASPDSRIAALSRRGDNFETWSFAPEDFPQGAYWYSDAQGWREAYPVPGPVGAQSSGIAAASRKDNTMEVWWVGPFGTVEGALWYDMPEGDRQWHPYDVPVAGLLRASAFSGLAAESRRHDHMEVWWIGIDGSVQASYWYQGIGTWKPYQIDGTGLGSASTTSGVAAVSRAANDLAAFWITPNGSVNGAYWKDEGNRKWRLYDPDKPITGPDAAAQTHCIAAVSRTSDTIDVLWITPRGEVAGARWSEGDHAWRPYAKLVAEHESASPASSIAVVSRGEDSMEAFWVGPGDSVRGARWEQGKGWILYKDPVAGSNSVSTSSGIGAAVRTDSEGRKHVLVAWIGPDRLVRGVTTGDETSAPDWVVHGIVRKDGDPYPDPLEVRAFNKTAAGDVLGRFTTGADGAYRIAYKKPNTAAPARRADIADEFALLVAAYTVGGQQVVQSAPRPTPARVEEINLDVVSDGWVVRGVVEDPTGRPISGVSVIVTDRDLGLHAENLPLDEQGRADSGSDGTTGGFRITYRPSQRGEGTRDGRWSPDLIFRLHIGGVQVQADIYRYVDGVRPANPLSATELIEGIAATLDEQVALRLTALPDHSGIEFDVLTAAIQPLLPPNTHAGLLNEEVHRDISFTARETGIDRNLIAMFVDAHRMAANDFKDVQADILYGLARSDKHLLTVAALTQATKNDLIDGIRQAIDGKIIRPRANDAEIERAADKIRAKGPALVLDGADGAPPYKDVLGLALGTDAHARDLQLAVIRAAEGNEHNPKAMWDALRRDGFPPEKLARTQLILQLDTLTSRHTKLMDSLLNLPGITTAKDLLALTAGDLEEMIKAVGDVPQDLPGDSDDEKARYWAAGLAANVHQAFPTLSVAGSVRNGPPPADAEVPDGDTGKHVVKGADLRTWVATALERAADIADAAGARGDVDRFAADQTMFDIGRSRLDSFINDHKDELFDGVPQHAHGKVAAELKRTQRLYRVSTSPAAMDWLLTRNYRSAFDIALTPQTAFVETASVRAFNGAPKIDSAEAIMMHSRARTIANAVMATHLHIADARFAAGIRALNPAIIAAALGNGAVGASGGAADIDTVTGKHLPSWVEQFGSANYCACKECQSIYSPAAYFVTLMDFLDAHPNAQGQKPLDVLLTRRPDLDDLLLTCENTNTQIPYVDLVNRVLESLVKALNPQDILAYDIAGASAAELAAAPQNTDWYAYITAPEGGKRPDRAAYPNRLPFDAALHASRSYLSHLGAPRTLLLKTSAGQAQPHALSAEYVQLAPAAFELITDTTLDNEPAQPVALDERYGFDVEPPEPLEQGSNQRPTKGRVVWALKQKLIAAGAALLPDADPANATYDATVTTAVSNYQTAQGLTVTGKTDNSTWRALTPGEPSLPSLLLSHVPSFLHRASLTYTELVDVLKMRFINPQRDIFDIVLRLQLPAKPLIEWIDDRLQGPVPAPLIEPLDKAKISPAEFRAWALRTFGENGAPTLRATIVVDNPNPAACDLETSVIRYWSDDEPDVRDSHWLRLDKVIRLWRTTGWTLDDLDLALTALQPDEDRNIDAGVIRGIARIAELSAALELLVPQVVVLFSDLDPTRPNSLYHRVFRNRASRHIDPAFEPDWSGEVLRDATIGKQLAALQSGLRIGDADMAALRRTLLLTDDGDELKISHVSAMLRYVTLARALSLNVRDLLSMLTIVTNKAAIDTDPPVDDDWPLRDFITEVQRLGSTDLNVAQLNNIISPVTSLAPSDTRERLLKDLATNLRAIDNDFNPDSVLNDGGTDQKAVAREALARRVLAMLEQPGDLVEAVMLILTGRDQSSTVVDTKITPAPSIPDAWQTRLRYQPQNPDQTATGGALVTCIGALTDDERATVKAFSADAAWAPAVDRLHGAPRATLTKLVNSLAKAEIAAPAPSVLLATALRDDPADRDADIATRLKKLIDATVPVVRDDAKRALINQTLLVIVPDPTTLRMLLTQLREATKTPVLPASTASKPLIDDLMRLGNGVITAQAHQAYELLARTQQLIDGFGLRREDLNVLVNTVISLRATSSTRLAVYADIRKVSAYTRCRRQLGGSAERLPEVLRATAETKAREVLAELMAVPVSVVADTVLALGVASLRSDPVVLERVLSAVKVVTSLGVSVSAAIGWVSKPATPPTVEQVRTRVDDIRRAVKARYDETAWLDVAKALHDPQRDARRTALVDYLVARLDWLITRNPDGLYQRLYLQVEMSSCMQTSPIRLAIDSVHTFIHRCLLGLEKPAVMPDQIDDERWNDVLHNQQIWRADLEVLVNPENYILPELRDDKSAAFLELEGALLSEELTDEAAERAITGYLEKADAVAKLDILALHVQRDFEPGEKLQAVVHVLGRSANVPYKHYYRRLVIADVYSEGWTPWEEVSLDVRGEAVTMVTFERRLFLFWTVATTKAVEGQAKPSGSNPPLKIQEIQLCWSEYRNGAWGPKQVTDESQVLVDDYEPETGPDGGATVQRTRRPKGIIERLETRIEGELLRVLCISTRSLQLTRKRGDKYESAAGPLAHGDWVIGGKEYKESDNTNTGHTHSLGTFVLDGCHGQLRADTTWDATHLNAGSLLFLGDGQLQIKALSNGAPIAASTVLGSVGTLRLGEEHWIHLGQDYFVFSDNERVYFGSLRRQGTTIAQSLFDRDINFPITKRDLRVEAAGMKVGGVMSSLAHVAKIADAQSRPWLGFSSGLALFASTVRPTRLPAANAAAAVGVVDVEPRNLIKVDIGSVNFARVGAFDVGLKSMFPQQTSADIVFETFYDPFVCTYLKRLRQYGIPGLLTLANQQLTTQELTGRSFESKYRPNISIVGKPFPTDKVDFGFLTPGKYRANAYAVTNRELFIEIPMLLAKRFREDRRFEESLRYLKYVWDFTDLKGDYWRAEPLRLTPAQSVEKWLTRLKDGDPELLSQIRQWQQHPFQPHFVARMRPSAYQRYVVMETLDTLLDWGDAEFRRDTMESITHAAQLYVLVADLLGPRPEEIATGTSKPKSFKDMRGHPKEGLAIVSAEFENIFPSMSSSTVSSNPDTVGLLGMSKSLYFCIPPNQKLLAYWDTVADRLFKIRHCMNIEGVVRQLPLFEPRIDPALLVRAAAQGIDLDTVIAEAGAPLPPYRFEVALRRALDACNVVTRLGSQLLSAIERGDAEKLAALNATHATAALKATLEAKKQQEEAAAAQITALQTSRDVPVQRLMYYQFLMGVESKVPAVGETVEAVSYGPKPQSSDGAWLIQEEINELAAAHSARDWQVRASTMQQLASLMHYIPTVNVTSPVVEVAFGGEHIGPALTAIGKYQEGLATRDQHTSNHAGRMAAHRRRGQEFAFGANTAAREIANIDKQITVAMINKEVARLEREQLELQIDQAETIESYLDTKFTNTKMYALIQSKLSTVYAQFYKLAYDLAKQAERLYRFRYPELAAANIIQGGNWESGRKGLLAGEHLELQLHQLGRAYADRDIREFELTKHVSLLQHAPMALIRLRETGSAEFNLPELLFDLDNPGHFRRRIKSVSLTIPAVVGPYATVNATLTLLSNQIRVKSTLKNQKYERDLENGDDRFLDDFAPIQQIATSSGQNDHGLFELNFRDERLLPFEGAGVANSRWRIVIDPDCNPFEIPDVVMTVRFVASQGGDVLRAKAKEAWVKILKDAEGLPITRMISMRHEFPTEWDRLRTVAEPGGEHTVAIALTRDRFPALFRRSDLGVGAIDVFGIPATDDVPSDLPDMRTPEQSPGESVDLKPGVPVETLLHEVVLLDDLVAVKADPDKAQWWLSASTPAQKDSLANLHDILLVMHYNAKKK